MRALWFDGNQASVRDDLDPPALKPGEAMIRPTRMGVCSTDLEICRGYMGFRGALGHEFVGVVEAVSDKPHQHWVGKRVVGSINCACGKCDLCRAGLREHCRVRTVLGILNRGGCFAERFTLPVENLYEVPANVDDDHAVFTEPLAAAFQVLRQVKIEGRPYITVLGDGRLGLLCGQVLNRLNATVRVVGKHESKLRLCEKWKLPSRPLDEVGLRHDQDIVVDCTGSASGLRTALQMVRPRGTIVMKTTVAPPAVGKPLQDRDAVDLAPAVINEVTVIGSRCGPFSEALRALSAQEVDVVSLIHRRMKLADGMNALKQANNPGQLKILLEP